MEDLRKIHVNQIRDNILLQSKIMWNNSDTLKRDNRKNKDDEKLLYLEVSRWEMENQLQKREWKFNQLSSFIFNFSLAKRPTSNTFLRSTGKLSKSTDFNEFLLIEQRGKARIQDLDGSKKS